MDGFKIDASEVRSLAEDFRRVPPTLARQAKPVVEQSIVKITNQLRDEMGASASFGALAGGISYDIDPDGYGAEAGPTKASRGGASTLGKGANIAYFGGSNGGGGTVPDPRGALDAEAPRFAQALSDLAAELLR